MTGMNPIAMTKKQLAGLYFPSASPLVGTHHLMRWINGCPPLMDALKVAGYHSSQKVLTSRQVSLVFFHLGEPG